MGELEELANYHGVLLDECEQRRLQLQQQRQGAECLRNATQHEQRPGIEEFSWPQVSARDSWCYGGWWDNNRDWWEDDAWSQGRDTWKEDDWPRFRNTWEDEDWPQFRKNWEDWPPFRDDWGDVSWDHYKWTKDDWNADYKWNWWSSGFPE